MTHKLVNEVAPRYLETSVERMLLEDRRYPRKTLFGEPLERP